MLSRKKEIELSELAESIANFYCPEGVVYPATIAQEIGVTYCTGDYEGAFDGLIEQENGLFHIFINTKFNELNKPRSRFTFAHELGHYFIDEHRNALLNGKTPSHPSYTNFSSKNPVEFEADFFASCLLLPENRIKADVYKKRFNFHLVESLASKYQTSITATLLRLMSIDKHPIMLVCSVGNRIKWFRYSHDFPFKWLRKPLGTVPKYTLAGSFFESGEKFNEELPVFANEWFEYVSDRDLERCFYEKCIYSERHNFVLSIIWEE